jgi:hypothetical protein
MFLVPPKLVQDGVKRTRGIFIWYLNICAANSMFPVGHRPISASISVGNLISFLENSCVIESLRVAMKGKYKLGVLN